MTTSGQPRVVLVLAGRGRLPYVSLHGEPLYLHALRALVEAFAEVPVVGVDAGDEERVRDEVASAGLVARVVSDVEAAILSDDSPRALLLHDGLCPLVPASFLREVHQQAVARPDHSLMAFRPVTDTVKTVVDGRIHGTIDRTGLAALTSPAVISQTAVRQARDSGHRLPLTDFAELAHWLRGVGTLELVRAPSMARRVDDASAVNLLECLDEVGRRVRSGG